MQQQTKTSEALFAQAQNTIPGGVNSPVRAFRSVGGTPRFFAKAKGAYGWDADGNRYVDYICSWGPAIVGHAHPEVIAAVQEAAAHGLSFGAPTAAEVEIAEWIRSHLPSMEMLRLTSSGTEATMSAIRVARGHTGRSKIIKFEGCYHGHVDSLLVKAGSGLLTFGNPTSAGVPKSFAEETLVLDYNDIEGVKKCFAEHGPSIAGVIVEPIAGNMNLVKPVKGFLEALREQCDAYGALLIFDEVMTGFRVGPQGVQGLSGIRPDLTTLGKVIGGGMPMGAFGGRKDVMQCVAPLGPVYQAGTLSGNPVAVAAGLATLRLVSAPGFFEQLTALTAQLMRDLTSIARDQGEENFCTDSVGGMFGIYFSKTPPVTFEDVNRSDREKFNRFFHAMLRRGVYLAPSAFEAGFVSIAHAGAPIEYTLQAAKESFAEIA
ncbi:MAG: glutamate-1-semialdehyde-2,1-aminomutase [Burkholderiaceae bacterium]|jgi:glutamate-1-semialdehyde 2,1-aminomutase|nr:glutamate-1-semialdehyde-2,1-aminomutase [Burkholderiaceae bacterium]